MPPTDTKSAVRTQWYPPNYDDLAYSTLLRIEDFGPSCGRDDRTEHLFKNALIACTGDPDLTQFANPIVMIRAPQPTPDFFQAADQARKRWWRQLKQEVFFTSGAMKREMKRYSPLIRQLMFTGVMIAAGEHLSPNNWTPPKRAPPPPHNLVGQVFGRLTVVERVPRGRWRCLCQCGQATIVRTKHLLHGSIKSCGCLKAEVDAWRRARRDDRGWICTKVLRLK